MFLKQYLLDWAFGFHGIVWSFTLLNKKITMHYSAFFMVFIE